MLPKILVMATLLTLTTSSSQAAGWRPFPVSQAGFKAEPTLAVIGGALNPSIRSADTDQALGIELSFNCIALQPPEGKLRTQVSYTKYDDSGLKINSFEINPHYLWPLGKGLEAGVGPGIGYVSGKSGGFDESALALQLGASLHYRSGPLFLGAEVRYQATQSDFQGDDLDNTRVMLKVGYNF